MKAGPFSRPNGTSKSGASAARVSVSVASAVLRLSPARPRQAPVRKWVIGSKRECLSYLVGVGPFFSMTDKLVWMSLNCSQECSGKGAALAVPPEAASLPHLTVCPKISESCREVHEFHSCQESRRIKTAFSRWGIRPRVKGVFHRTG